MLTKIAWKNIWRNRVRSVILIIAIALGIWALTFINGVAIGMVNSYVENAIQNRTSHLQVHLPAFENEKETGHFFDARELNSFLDTSEFVQDYTTRILINGMVNSAHGSRGITLYGVDPEMEDRVTHLNDKIIEGDSLNGEMRNVLLITGELAKKLGVKIRSKVVVNFQNASGEVTASAFRIAGLLENMSGKTDDIKAYTRLDVLQELTGLEPGRAHEVAILVNNLDNISIDQNILQTNFPDLSTMNYEEISPEVALMRSQMVISLSVMIIIFMLALIFGIINTMLMAVLERYKELGMLLAVGMKKVQLFKMVVLETIFLSMVGLPLGLVMGALTISLTQHYGINLERWASGLKEFGLLMTIYPSLSLPYFLIIGLVVLLTAIIASIYPARKATSLNPIEALRKI